MFPSRLIRLVTTVCLSGILVVLCFISPSPLFAADNPKNSEYLRQGYQLLNEAAEIRYESDSKDSVRRAIDDALRCFEAFRSETHEFDVDWRNELAYLDGLIECYKYIIIDDLYYENNDTPFTPEFDFEYDGVIESEQDSLSLARISKEGIMHTMAQAIAETELTNDLRYENCTPSVRRIVDLMRRKYEILNANDPAEARLYGMITLVPYLRNYHLLTDAIALCDELIPLYEDDPEIWPVFNLLQLKYESYSDLASPLFSPINARHSSTPQQMTDYLKKSFDVAEEFVQLMERKKTDIDSLEFIHANTIDNSYGKVLKTLAYDVYSLAKYYDNEALYRYAHLLLIEAVSRPDYSAWDNLHPCLAACNVRLGIKDSVKNISDSQNSDFSDILDDFRYAGKRQRELLWQNFLAGINSNLSLALALASDEYAGELVYNAMLYKKGILLASDNNFLNALRKASFADSEFAGLKDSYLRNFDNGISPSDSLMLTIEKRLIPQLRFTDYHADLKKTYADVKKALRPGEAAIEFGEQENGIGLYSYFAAILLPELDKPIICNLGNLKFGRDQLHHNCIDSIAAALKPYIGNYNTIYFAMDGNLHLLPFESFSPLDKNWIRLSSTRLLCAPHRAAKSGKGSMLVYGDIDFDNAADSVNSSVDDLLDASDSIVPVSPGTLKADSLPNTRGEINSITDLAGSRSMKSKTFSGSGATELSLRNELAAASVPAIIHFATHGFYFTPSESKGLWRATGYSDGLFNPDTSERNALSRSGLLLAGANRTFSGVSKSPAYNDGVLLSSEIQSFNLSDVDFISLSACDTGLGDITSDGIFGLQRSFKKAGANSLLMTLWKVDDRATGLLMTKFYELYLGGVPKHDALAQARAFVRDYEEESTPQDADELTGSQRRRARRTGTEDMVAATYRPFENPVFWAAFILLDAFN